MSFTSRLVLWLHVAFALLTIGPLIVATMSTPRYVRTRNLPVLRYLARMTRIYSVISLGVLILGIVLAELRGDFSRPWLSVSMTLFVVTLVLLLLIMRDQHRAIAALDSAAKAQTAGGPELSPAPATEATATGAPIAAGASAAEASADGASAAGASAAGASAAEAPAGEPAGGGQAAGTGKAAAPAVTQTAHLASVERGRIASMAGLASLIWLVILALMIWQP
jgi:hypothetical protein